MLLWYKAFVMPPTLISVFLICFPFTATILCHDQKRKQLIHVQVSVRQWTMSLQFPIVGGIGLSMLLLYATEDAHLVMPTLPTSICAQQRELASKIKTESKTCYLTVTNYL